jgi:aminomethyltransferase
MSEASSRSPLHALNEDLGARFVDFGGWEMPVQYQSVLTEHRAVRSSAAWFDVSHLGRFLWRGTGASTALNRLLTNDATAAEPGRTQYTLCLDDDGGILDDLLVWQWDEDFYWVLPNASTHRAMMERFATAFPDVEIEDLRGSTAMVAVQGPDAPAALEATLGVLPRRFRTYRAPSVLSEVHLAGTGYTGERGGEFVADPETATRLLERLIGLGVKPAGLGARDTLRLEAGLLLAGQDFDRQTNPIEAGLDFAVAGTTISSDGRRWRRCDRRGLTRNLQPSHCRVGPSPVTDTGCGRAVPVESSPRAISAPCSNAASDLDTCHPRPRKATSKSR